MFFFSGLNKYYKLGQGEFTLEKRSLSLYTFDQTFRIFFFKRKNIRSDLK